MASLFTRLASYSQNPSKKSLENFSTEVIAHLINTDPAFRRAFITHVIPDGRMRRHFGNATALPQQSYGNGIVDLVLSGKSRRVLVEIKIGAKETLTKIRGRGVVSQIRKYVSYRDGHVAYLTTRNVAPPFVSSKLFLGQTFIEDLHEKLPRARLTSEGKLFAEFLEDNGMSALEAFSKKDISVAQNAWPFAAKCEATVDAIVAEIEPDFRRMFRTRAGFTSGHFSPTYKSSYATTRGFSRKGVKGIHLFLEASEGQMGFGVWVRVLREDLKRLNDYLTWDEGSGAIYTWHTLLPNRNAASIARALLKDLERLRRALNRV